MTIVNGLLRLNREMKTVEMATATRRRGVCCDLEDPLEPGVAESTAELLKAIADPTRLSMLATLDRAREPVCVCDFTAQHGLSQPTISHHMGKLRAAGLVSARRDGVWVYYSLVRPLPVPVAALLAAID